MVGHLVSLKWRYVIASLKRSVWALIGIILGVLYLVGILIGLGFLYSFLAFESPEGAASLALLIGTLLCLGWMLVPIFVSGLDGTLDESRFVLFPIEPKTLQKGQFLGGFIGIPGIATITMVLIGALGYLTNPLGLLLYLLCALLGLATLMCIARIGNQVGVYLNANPRINLILMLTAGILLMSSGFIFAGATAYIGENFEQIAPYVVWLGYTPFGAAFAVPLHAVAGNWILAAVCLVLALVYLAGTWWLWGRQLERSIRNVSGQTQRGTAKALSVGNIGVFAKFPSTPVGAVAARTLHSYLKDARMSVSAATLAMMYVLLGIFVPMVNSGFFRTGRIQLGMDTSTAGIEAAFSFWVYFSTISVGYYIMYSVSYDNTAFSLHVLSPLRGRDDRLGRALGYSVLMVPVVVIMTFAVCLIHGVVGMYPAVLLHQLGTYAAALGVGLYADTLLSPPAPAPGSNPLKTPKQTDGMAKNLLTMVVMLICMAATIPAFICVFIYTFGSHEPIFLWVGGIIQMVVGGILLALGVVIGGKSYDRNSHAMLQRVAKFTAA